MRRYNTIVSFIGGRPLRALCLCIVVLVFSVQSRAQSLYPAGSVPMELTRSQIITDTLFDDSLVHLMSGAGPFATYPDSLILVTMFPTYTGSDPRIWGPLSYQGHTFNLTFEVDPSYFAGLPLQPPLLRQGYTLKIYAPGDVTLTTPIYENDSVYMQLNGMTPRIDFRVNLDTVFGRYIPQTGLRTVDSTDTLAYVIGILDSIVVARNNGQDSITLGGNRICFDSALYLVDSADIAFRGVSSSLMRNQVMYYTLTLNTGQSYTLTGFSAAPVHARVSVSYGVLYTPGRLLPDITGSTAHTDPGDGRIIKWHTDCDTSLFSAYSVTTGNPVTYTWKDCPFINYEIQILRLYNIDGSLTSDPHSIKATVDWSQALDLETNNGQQSIRLTTAEGSGYYVWRVRRIYDYQPNTIGDNQNWGRWTDTGPFTDGATLSVTTGMISGNPYLFYYDVFDDTLNYIYHRQFVEGEINHGSQLRIGEKTTFANYLLMPQQEQVRAQQADTIIASQTIPDYNGRPMLQTLPAPVGKHGFGYEYDYIKNDGDSLYTANNYDQQTNYRTPSIVNGTSKLVQYYSNINGDLQIPNSDSLPFTRTLNYNDGLNRVREVSSPGMYHSFGSGHSVKKYYCSPASDELIRIFGDEAPSSESVLKTYTVDPNGVLNISYTDEITGKVLATCLSAPQSSLLDTIPDDKFTVSDTVKAKIKNYYPSRITETRTYTFALPTELRYTYDIVSDIYGDTCVGLCASCDYIVHITARNIDDTDDTHMFHKTIIIAPNWDTSGIGACNTAVFEQDSTYGIIPIGGSSPVTLLDPGTYVVTATILLGNLNPSTGVAYITEMDTLMLRKLRHELLTTPGTVLGGTGGGTVTLAGIQGYLNSLDMDGLLAYTGADTSHPYFQFVVGCDTFLLPTEHCKKHDCSTIDFAEYMVAQLGQYDTDNGVTTFSGITDINATVDAANLFLVANNAEFNSVIQTMIDSGYNCDTLWNCWTSTVRWYANTEYVNTTSFPGATHADWWQHFMELATYKFPFMPRPYAQLTTTGSDVRKFPFKYFPYDTLSNTNAENAFCYLYTLSLGGTPSTPFVCGYSTTTWMAAAENFPVHLPTHAFHMYNFYLSIKPSSPSYVVGVITTGGLSGMGTGTVATYAAMEDACYKLCDSRYNALADQVADQFRRQGIKVPGYPYLSWDPQPPTDSVTLSKVYCIVSTLVSHCKEGCVLTPDPVTGIVPANQILAYEQSMVYSMDFIVSVSDTPLSCGTRTYGHDTSVIVPVDPTHYKDSTYMIPDGVDSGFVNICNTDTNFSQNAAMLDWLNNRYSRIYDSMAAVYTLVPYEWHFMSEPGMNSFGGAGVNCSKGYVEINGLGAKGYFSYDTTRTVTNACTGYTAYRISPRSAFIHSTMKMLINVVVSSPVPVGDSIVVLETVPATGTVISSNGTVIGGTLHFSSGGPLIAGDTIKFHYDLLMPYPAGTDVAFSGQVVRYTGGSPSSCTLSADTTTADTCETLYFNMPPGGARPVNLCLSCWTPMDCHACICFRYAKPDSAIATDSIHIFTCAEFVCNAFTNSINVQMQQIEDWHSSKLQHAYEVVCNDPGNVKDLYVNKYDLNQYQYTLYYYDRAGNLIRTVAPQGVRDTATARYGPPGHYSRTEYEYNTLGQMLRQKTPDGGETFFWYDRRGKVRLSQNDHQKAYSAYSYTKYDALARVIEAGEFSGYTPVSYYPYVDTNDLYDATFPVDGGSYAKTFITKTVYSTPCPTVLPGFSTPYVGNNLQNRISYVVTDRDGDWTTTDDEVWSIYSYDTHGNVATLIQYVSTAPDAMEIDYQYDVVSNKVVKVEQHKMLGPGSSWWAMDDFNSQWYSYDGDKRLIKVQSTFEPGGVWAPEAAYSYYLHGPLRRHLVGRNVQGVDYTYTLQGWLKAINHSKLELPYDPGNDSATVGKDVFGMVLNYFQGDFNRTGSPFNSIGNALNLTSPTPVTLGGGDLFNGNITSWMQNIQKIPLSGAYYDIETANSYRYDQLNRITKSRFWFYNAAASQWERVSSDSPNPYDENFSYDRNGNLQTLDRTALDLTPAVVTTDNLLYRYNSDVHGDTINQLDSITDVIGAPITGMGDVASTKYTYNEIGQLIEEVSPDQYLHLSIRWTPYGKVDSITRYSYPGTTVVVAHRYLYDGMGNQVQDIKTATGLDDTTYHLYDGHNTKMAVYHMQESLPGTDRQGITERYLYGSDRIATLFGSNISGFSCYGCSTTHWIWGPSARFYELHDHLGNVRVNFGNGAPGPTSLVGVQNYYNYYAFGSYEPKRVVEGSAGYSFSFNSKEKKDDWRGPGNSMDFGARNYDARIGRFIARDPFTMAFPSITPYDFAANSPISSIDYEGCFRIDANTAKKYPAMTKLLADFMPGLKNDKEVKKAFMETTGVTEAQFDEIVTFGTGPWVSLASQDNPTGLISPKFTDENQYEPNKYGGKYINNLFIKQEYFDEMEQAAKNAIQKQDSRRLVQAMIISELVILHEATHFAFFNRYGAEGNHGVRDMRWGGNDKGFDFYYRLFGNRLSKDNGQGESFDREKVGELLGHFWKKNDWNQQKIPWARLHFQFIWKGNAPEGQKGDPASKE